jgi:hypothetical protein
VGGGFHDHLVFRLQPLPADVIEGRTVHALIAERVDLLSGRIAPCPEPSANYISRPKATECMSDTDKHHHTR